MSIVHCLGVPMRVRLKRPVSEVQVRLRLSPRRDGNSTDLDHCPPQDVMGEGGRGEEREEEEGWKCEELEAGKERGGGSYRH